ncbi:MAG: hypothetical protein HKN21_17520, partial [Candidatus Eisenbacteria bacterium]|nr:hypothetical protein [Candidatus Eisenbacteria bacterium]
MNAKPTASRFGLHVILVFLVAILVRVWFVMDHLRRLPIMRSPDQDSAMYETWAKTLLSGVMYTSDVFTMAPGFPLFLSFWYRLAGTDPLAAVLMQCTLGVVTTMMVVFLTRRLFGDREAIVAGLLYTGMPALYFYETKLLPTTLALWLLVFSLLLLQIAYQNKRISLYFLAGIVTGLLVVVRANMLIYGGLVFLGLLWAAWKTRNQPKIAAVLFVLGIAISMGPVMAHNLGHGELVPVAANGGINLYIGNHPEARGVYVD